MSSLEFQTNENGQSSFRDTGNTIGYSEFRLVYIAQTSHLFLLRVEILDDDTNKQIESEERSEHNKHNKVDIGQRIPLIDRIIINLDSCISRISHYLHPSFICSLQSEIVAYSLIF